MPRTSARCRATRAAHAAAEQLTLWPDLDTARAAESALIGAVFVTAEHAPTPELVVRRAKVLAALGSLQKALASYLEVAAALGEPADLPGDVPVELLPARWCEALAARLEGLISARRAVGLPVAGAELSLRVLRGQGAQGRHGFEEQSLDGQLSAATLHAIWQALGDRRLRFLASLTQESADRLLAYQLMHRVAQEPAPSASAAAPGPGRPSSGKRKSRRPAA